MDLCIESVIDRWLKDDNDDLAVQTLVERLNANPDESKRLVEYVTLQFDLKVFYGRGQSDCVNDFQIADGGKS